MKFLKKKTQKGGFQFKSTLKKKIKEIVPIEYIDYVKNLLEKILKLLKSKKQLLEEDCNKLKFYNCYQQDNACYFNLKDKVCHHDDDYEIQLQEAKKNPKKTLVCPIGKYQRKYRGIVYCSDYKPKISELSNYYTFLGTLFLGPVSVFPVKYSYETIKDVYYALSGNRIKVLIEGYLKINFKGFVLGIVSNLITITNINLFMDKSEFLGSNDIGILRIFSFNLRKKIILTTYKEDIFNYFINLKNIFSKIVTGKTNEEEKISVLFGRIYGNFGAQEEYIFREFLIELLNTKIKIPTEKLLKKIFNKSNNIDQKINGIYWILETFLSGCLFGLYHLTNLGVMSKEDVFEQVFLTTFMGFFLNIIKSINPNVYLVWLVHYYHNFLASTVFDKTSSQFQK